MLETGEHAQLVVMTLAPGEEIGAETHEGDQILFFVEGEGEAILEGESSPVQSGAPSTGRRPRRTPPKSTSAATRG